jgi:uncharacterized protein (TIGR02145 family)
MKIIQSALTSMIAMILFYGCTLETELHIVKNDKEATFSIGEQTWMINTLNKKYFNNGEAIPQAQSSKEWEKAGRMNMPAWCYVSESDTSKILYNWYAISDPRGLAPKGWHMPSYHEVEYVMKMLYTLNHLDEKKQNIVKAYPIGFRY